MADRPGSGGIDSVCEVSDINKVLSWGRFRNGHIDYVSHDEKKSATEKIRFQKSG
jgi:hypothetical protein